MNNLVLVGSFCPNPECTDYGITDGSHIIRYGKTKAGRQRFQCKSCQKTFNEHKGTVFYQRKTEEKDILECLALLAEGSRISSISRVKGIKEDTILSFLRQAAKHVEQIEQVAQTVMSSAKRYREMSNKLEPKTEQDELIVYQIKIKGHLGSQWKDWFGGMTITLEDNGDTLLTGVVVDQAALYGLLRKVRGLGTPLLSVIRIKPDNT